MACGLRGTGAGLGAKWPTGAIVELKPDGRLLLRVGCADIGQGSETVFRQIAAEATGISFDRIDILAGDTALTPEGSRIAASRQTIQTGNAVLMAAEEFKTMLKHYAGERDGLDINAIDIRGDRIIATESGKEQTTLEEIAEHGAEEGVEIKAEKEYHHPQTYHLSEDVDAVIESGGKVHYMAYAYTACVAVVEVDEETGAVKVLKLISANEVGRPMNPLSLEGQIEGSVIQGMGYALSEEFKTKEGFPLTKTMAQCRVPKIGQIPEIIPIAVDARDPVGPYGAKGVGEIAILPVPPAITNAIFNAVGVRIKDLPATREKIVRLLRFRNGSVGHGPS
jgi:CO/xanthine dehydrogenase Mo-binding subunit